MTDRKALETISMLGFPVGSEVRMRNKYLAGIDLSQHDTGTCAENAAKVVAWMDKDIKYRGKPYGWNQDGKYIKDHLVVATSFGYLSLRAVAAWRPKRG